MCAQALPCCQNAILFMLELNRSMKKYHQIRAQQAKKFKKVQAKKTREIK